MHHTLFKNLKNCPMKKQNFGWARLLVAMACGTPETTETPEAKPETTTEAPAPMELTGDLHVAEGKAALAKLSSGDVDGWMEQFADNAMYRWNNGDSLAGKAAISEYWKARRGKDIKTITFSNDIWLSMKVNTPQNEFVAPGQWLMSWYKVDATYSNGKSMTQWIHTDIHFNDAGKIDILIQYVDRAPIMKAMAP
jgi:ketosteroid isomerase-like protein